MSYNKKRRLSNSRRRYAPMLTRAAMAGMYGARQLGKTYTAWRNKYKGRGSRIRTRRRGPKNGLVTAGTAGISHSSCSVKGKQASYYRIATRGLRSNTTRVVNTTRVEWNAGAQAANAYTFLDYNRISNLFVAHGFSTVGASTVRMWLKSSRISFNLTNVSNANCFVTIYDVVSKGDAVSGADVETPLTAWTTGLGTQASGTGSDTRTAYSIGVTPFSSPDFCRGWKVRKVTKIYLELGKSHIHNVYINAPRLFNARKLDNSGAQLSAYRNLTHSCLVVCTGMPVNDQTTDTLIAMGSGALNVVTTDTITYYYDDAAAAYQWYDDNQGTITTEKFVNMESGAVDAYAEA